MFYFQEIYQSRYGLQRVAVSRNKTGLLHIRDIMCALQNGVHIPFKKYITKLSCLWKIGLEILEILNEPKHKYV